MTCLFLMKNSLKPLAALLPALLTLSSAEAQSIAVAGSDAVSTLPSITVYASRFEEKLADALPQTSIVTAAEIQKSGASNVSEVLSRVAGLPVRTNLDGSTNAVVDMRGYGETASNNVVVLLDGVRLSENEQTVARTSMIPLEAIDHIEITKTGNSVLYGDGATGGTINIVTRKNVGHLTVVSGGLASYAGYQSGVYHSQALESSEVSLFARQYASDNYRSNARGTELSAGGSWIKHIDAQTKIGARFFSSQERNKLPGALPSIDLNSSPRDTQVPGYNYEAQVDSNALTLFGNKKINDIELAIDLNKRVRENHDAYRYDAYLVSSYYDPDAKEQSYGNSSSRTESQSVNPRFKINNFLFSNNSLQAGYDWQKSTKSGDGFLTFGYGYTGTTSYTLMQQKDGIYLRDILELSDSDRVVFGYRKEKYAQNAIKNGKTSYESNGSATAQEIEYAKKLRHDLVAYVRASQNFRIPNADDNNNVGAASLVVQTSRDLDIGLNHRSERTATELSYFHSRVKNEIGYDPSGCSYIVGADTYYYGCNVNYQPTKREGLHLRQRMMLSRDWTVRGNLQYIHARFVDGLYSGKTVPSVAGLSGSLSLDYQMSPKEQIVLTTRFSQSRYMSGDYENNQPKVAGYAVEDLSYFYKEKNWSLVASIINITDKKYTDVGIYKPADSGYLYPYNLTVYPNPGRSFSLTGRYAF